MHSVTQRAVGLRLMGT